LRFDFGPAGRAALERLRGHSNKAVAGLATLAAKAGSRWDIRGTDPHDIVRSEALGSNTPILPAGSTLPVDLAVAIASGEALCKRGADCMIYLLPGGREALLFDNFCFGKPADPDLVAPPRERCGPDVYRLQGGRWTARPDPLDEARRRRLASGFSARAVEIRRVEARQAYVGGEPVGTPF
jgi:hypothetical protein